MERIIKIIKNKITGAVISFLLGTLLALICGWAILHWGSVRAHIYNWQQLLGSMLGAAAPIGLFLWNEKYQRAKRKEDLLLLLEKNIVTAINNLADIDRMLHGFLDTTLRRYRLGVAEDDRAGRHSVGQAFVPLSSAFTFDREIFKDTTGSSYLENLIMDVVSTSQEMPLLLQDISRQFDRTLAFNTQIGLMKLTPTAIHNRTLLSNLDEFEGNPLKAQTFGNNIPVYLRKLVQTKVAIETMTTLGLRGWKQTFNYPPPFSPETSQKMTDYFAPEVNRRISDLQKDFKSVLLKVGEQP